MGFFIVKVLFFIFEGTFVKGFIDLLRGVDLAAIGDGGKLRLLRGTK
jgi:hypothetical protein